jgi:hypothetical protein
MLAATPAFAQSNNMQSGSPASGGNLVAPPAHEAAPAKPTAPATASADNSASMAPKGGTGDHVTHAAAMPRHSMMHASKSDTSQDAAVDQLNNQSYQAAQKGEAFSGSPAVSGSTSMSSPSGSSAGGMDAGSHTKM